MRNKGRAFGYILTLLIVVGGLFGLTACINSECDHQWIDATCTQPKTCELCQATEGDALGHHGGSTSCTEQAVCNVCGVSFGEAGEHDWVGGSCTEEKHCSKCDAVDTKVLGHHYGEWVAEIAATCETEGTLGHYTCSTCETKFDADKNVLSSLVIPTIDHTCGEWIEEVPATCENEGSAGHFYCSVCYKNFDADKKVLTSVVIPVLGHADVYTSLGNGTHTVSCSNGCGATQTVDCTGGEATCTDKAECELCKEEYGAEPQHQWEESGVTRATCTADGTRYYSCGVCHETKSEPILSLGGHRYENDGAVVTTLPTCVENGYTTYSCDNCDESHVADEVAAAGNHTWDRAEVTCTEGRSCTVNGCGVTEDAMGHDHKIVHSTAATCTDAAVNYYECSRCDDKYDETVGTANGHSTKTEKLSDNDPSNDCGFVQRTYCEHCDYEELGEVEWSHSYTATITTAATCIADGEKTLTCSKCGDVKTEVIEKNPTGHAWVNGIENDGKRVDTCSNEGCDATKTVTVFKDTNQTDSTNANDLKDTEIELNDTNISLDSGVIDTIGDKEVTVSADKYEGEERDDLGLTNEQLQQIGNSPIYNFTISDGENNISQFGENNFVTITLPYTLEDGEDVDSIYVWFISDEGVVEPMKATYNEVNGQGYVTFQTNHFSYYTVTKLTPQQRCEEYGHPDGGKILANVVGGCLTDGYVEKFCPRCHETWRENEIKAPGAHDYLEVTTAATCTTDGLSVFTCQNDGCNASYTVRIPATGHSYNEIEHVDATCEAAGYVKYICANGCDAERIDPIPQLTHDVKSEVIAPTCEAYGYTHYWCDNCTYSYTDTMVAPIGHNYVLTWNWSEDFSEATAIFVCENDASHVINKTATVKTKVTDATCSSEGSIVYTATVVNNGVTYTDTKTKIIPIIEHEDGFRWMFNHNQHWKKCACGNRIDVVDHSFDTVTVIKAATCTEEGEQILSCVCGATRRATIPAGNHSITEWNVTVAPTCVDKGEERGDCQYCDYHETREIEALGHTLGEWNKEVAATCEQDGTHGYFNCSVCEKNFDAEKNELTDLAIPALGHNCGQWISEVSADCENTGVLGHYHCSTCEKNFDADKNELKSFEIPALGHAYGEWIDEISADCDESGTRGHYHCSVCEKNFDADKTVLRTLLIPATGVHTYENGVCTGCGKEEIDCDHQMHEVVIDLSQYGCCTKELRYLSCECGDYTELDFEKIQDQILCKLESNLDVPGDTGVVGSSWSVDLSCSECGLHVVGEGTRSEDLNCRHIIEHNVDFYIGETLIVESVSSFYYDGLGNCNKRWEEIPLSEYGCCVSILYVYRCVDCGRIYGFDIDIDHCDMEITESDDGRIHTYTCKVCGLTAVEEETVTALSPCETKTVYDYRVSCEGVVILEYSEPVYYSSSHQYERSYEFHGETCEDGYTVHEYCSVCGDSRDYTGEDHNRDQYEWIDLGEYGLCGGEVRIEKCSICDTVVYGSVYDYDCDWNYEGTNEEGYDVRSCNLCGVVRYSKSVPGEKDENCNRTYMYTYIYCMNGEEVVRFELPQKWLEHQHVVTGYEFMTEQQNCERGVRVIYTCVDCGDSYTLNDYHHRSLDLFALTEDHDCCDSHSIEIYGCPCGYYYLMQYDSEGLVFDEEQQAYVCENCELKVIDRVDRIENGCELTELITKAVMLGEETLYSKVISSNSSSNHDFANVSVTTNEGITTVTTSCTKCDAVKSVEMEILEATLEYNKEFSGYAYDFTVVPEIDGDYTLAPLTLAYSGYFELFRIQLYEMVDGELIHLCSYRGMDYMAGIYGLSYYLDAGTTYVYRIGWEHYSDGSTILFTFSNSSDEIGCNHGDRNTVSFGALMDGATSCTDGVFSGKLYTACGCISEVSIEYNHGFHNLLESYDLTEFNFCGGKVKIYECACGENKYMNWNWYECYYIDSWDNHTDENGIYHEICTYTCQTCGAVVTMDGYSLKEGCYNNHYNAYTFTINGEIVLEYTYINYRSESHTYYYECELQGESCEDGVLVRTLCKNCDYVSEHTVNHHERHTTTVDLTDYGFCGGYVAINECACGYSKNLNWSQGCTYSVTGDNLDNENGLYHYVRTYTCVTCGAEVMQEDYYVKEGCIQSRYYTWTFKINGETFLEYTYLNYSFESHDYHYEYELQGESCEDGVLVRTLCKNCDYVSDRTVNYHEQHTTTKDLADYGFCGGTVTVDECACGYSKSLNWSQGCTYSRTYDSFTDENGIYHEIRTYTCETCGARVTRDRYTLKEGCYNNDYYTWTFTINGETVLEYTYVYSCSENHNYRYEYVLQGESCEDGVYVKQTCVDCDYESSWSTHYHGDTYSYHRIEGFCNGNYMELGICACGEQGNCSTMVYCGNLSVHSYTDEDGISHAVETWSCTDCGMKWIQDRAKIKETECNGVYYETYSFYKEDEVICEYSFFGNTWNEHDHTYNFTLTDGVSCDGGYTLEIRCTHCDYIQTSSGYGHARYQIEYHDLAEFGFCGGYTYLETCACGYSQYAGWSFGDGYTDSYDWFTDENGISHEIYMCTCVCGRGETLTRDRYTLKENCYNNAYYAWTFTINGETVLEYTYVYSRSEAHNYRYEYVLQGESCEDGVYVKQTCVDCDYESSRSTHYHGDTYSYHRIEGFCNGNYMELGICACGEQGNCYTMVYCGNLSVHSYTDEDGISHAVETWSCTDCGMKWIQDRAKMKETECNGVYYETYSFYKEGELISEYSFFNGTWEEHDYIYNFSLTDGVSCENGYTVTITCSRCEYSREESGYGHNHYRVEYHDLAALGACHGYLELYSCACGQSTGFNHSFCWTKSNSNSYMDENGILHYVDVYECETCGMRYQDDYYSVRDASTCQQITYHSVSVFVGENGVLLNYERSSESHDYIQTGELMEGATDCNDGVIVTYTCRDCGYSYSNHYYHHYEVELNRIDLSQYGSLCGGYAVERGCACGYYHSVSLEALCDLGHSDTITEGWIDGALSGDYNDPQHYYHYTIDAGIYTCAVTDPERCAFKIRYAKYALKDEASCTTTWYETWQFGYNEETGECLYELTFSKGSKGIYHNFTQTDISETLEDGTTVSGYCYDCPDCGTYYHYKDFCNADGEYVKYEQVYDNKLDIGTKYEEWIDEYAYFTYTVDGIEQRDHQTVRNYHKTISQSGYVDEYEYRYEYNYDYAIPFGKYGYERVSTYTNFVNGSTYIEKRGQVIVYTNSGGGYWFYTYEEWQYPNDNDRWYRYDYEYSFENGCTRVPTYTDSNGANEVREAESCHPTWYYTTIQAPTCTQDGLRGHQCPLCEQTFDEYVVNPNGHNWYRISDQLYICRICGMQNVNGADGSVVIEDLTEEYGNGEYFVAGYWDKTNVTFEYWLVLKLHTPMENGDDEVYLYDIEIMELENVRALAFSRAAVIAAAEALGYTADQYDVRLVFVPYGADGSFDYAITFTDDECEEHDYHHEYVLRGESCTDGVTEIITCSNCDYIGIGNYWNYHKTYTFYNSNEDPACCDTHYVTIQGCACGETYYCSLENPDSFTHDAESQSFVCDNCDLSFVDRTEYTENGCELIETRTLAVIRNEETLYSKITTDVLPNHNFANVNATNSDGVTNITTSCNKCGTVKGIDMQILKADLEQHGEMYYYDFTVAPEASGEYTILGLGDRDTYVTLYRLVDGELEQIGYNDDNAGNGQFRLSYDLNARETYVYRIRFYSSSNSGTIPFMFFNSSSDERECTHVNQNTTEFGVLTDGATSCGEGVAYCQLYINCGCIGTIRTSYSHEISNITYCELSEFGFCGGTLECHTCPCGEIGYLITDYECIWQEKSTSSYIDENGVYHDVCISECSNGCGSKIITNHAKIKETECNGSYYHTYTFYMENQQIVEYSFFNTTWEEHNYQYEYELQGDSCEDGVLVKTTCSDCNYYSEWVSYSHNTDQYSYRINAEDYGFCGGYLEYNACACGEYGRLINASNCALSVAGECSSYLDAEGNLHDVHVWSCSACEFEWRSDCAEVKETECSGVNYYTHTIYRGDELIAEYSFVHGIWDTWEDHDFVHNITLADGVSCENGYVVTSVCTRCGYSYSRSGSGHLEVLSDGIKLAEYGCCGGYFGYNSCACGAYYSMASDFDFYCWGLWSNREEYEYTDSDGISHTVRTGECSKCGLQEILDTKYGTEIIMTYSFYKDESLIATYSFVQ